LNKHFQIDSPTATIQLNAKEIAVSDAKVTVGDKGAQSGIFFH
jgi:hypothetical protein